MNNTVLDDFGEPSNSNRKWIVQLGLVAITTVIIYYIIEYLRYILPVNLYQSEETQINTAGLLIILVLITNSVIIPTLLNNLKPRLSITKTVLLTGLILMVIELSFKITQFLFTEKAISTFAIAAYGKSTLTLAIIGSAVANIRAHKLNNRRMLTPVILMITIWLVIAYLAKITS